MRMFSQLSLMPFKQVKENAYSDLSRIKFIRRISKGKGGGKKYTELNFLSLLTDGNETRIFVYTMMM